MYDLVVSLRMAALGLLARQPGSGYDLLKTFEKSMANVWSATQSQLYGELNKLADDGLIEVTDVGPRGPQGIPHHAGRTRRTAALGDEPRGRPAVSRCFAAARFPARRDRTGAGPQAHGRGRPSTPTQRSKRLEELRDSIDWTDGDSLFFGRAALEYGLRRYAMEARLGPLGRRRARQAPQEIDPSIGPRAPNTEHVPTDCTGTDRSTGSPHRLREGRTADVPSHEIPTIVSAWLAEFGVRSPLVDDLARAVDADDWPAAHAIGEFLSVDVTVAASGRRQKI